MRTPKELKPGDKVRIEHKVIEEMKFDTTIVEVGQMNSMWFPIGHTEWGATFLVVDPRDEGREPFESRVCWEEEFRWSDEHDCWIIDLI